MDRTILRNVCIIDGTGVPAIEDGVLVMRHDLQNYLEDKIEYVGSMNDFSMDRYSDSTNRVLNLQGYTVLPGLINVHAHLDLELPYLPYLVDKFGDSYRTLVAYRRAAEALDCGVTTVRNVGGAGDFDIALRKAVEKNLVWASRIVACGSPIAPHSGHGNTVPGTVLCSGKAEFLRAVRNNIEKDVDQIKLLYTGGLAGASENLNDMQITEDELAVAISAAHDAHRKVAAHLSFDGAIRTSVRLGVDSVEHAYCMSQETTRLMKENGTYLVPTLCVSHCGEILRFHGASSHTLVKLEQSRRTHLQSIRNAIEAGVKICVGTDLLPSDLIDGTNATVREIELLAEAGMCPMEAIHAATANGAELCGLQNTAGTLKAGLEGDIIVVKGRPDQDIATLRNIRLVAKGCRLVWSTLPDMDARRFQILPPGCEMEGGSYIKW